MVNNQISGVLKVNAPAASLGKRAFAFSLPPGDYAFTGTLTPPRTYAVTGTANGISFAVNGLLPTATLDGSYEITAAGQSAKGILPKGSIALS